MPNATLMPNGLPAVDDGSGNMRVLACLSPHRNNAFPKLSQQMSASAPPQWQEIQIDQVCKLLLTNQGSQSSCVGHGTGTCWEAAWQMAGQVMPADPFSRTYVYSWVNGGQDAGAVISEAATALTLHGDCTIKEAPEGAIFRRQLAKDADQVASRYKPLIIMHCQTYDEICAAIAVGFPVVLGITVGRNFSNLDGFGLSPLPDVPLGGHCLAGLRLMNHPQFGWVVGAFNSWGKWGVNGSGLCYLRREHFDQQTDAFAIQAVASNIDTGLPIAMA